MDDNDDDRQGAIVRKCQRISTVALGSQSSSLHLVLLFHRTETCLEFVVVAAAERVAVGEVDSFCVPGKGAIRAFLESRFLFLGAVIV